MLPKALHAMHFPPGRNLGDQHLVRLVVLFVVHLAQRRTHNRLSVESNKIHHRLRVVANFGDGDYGAGKYTRTHARTKISPNSVLPSRRVSSKFRARVCVYFARPTIAINKIRDHSQSNYTNGRILRLSTRRTTRRITKRNKHCLLKFIPDGWYKTGRYIFTQHCSCNAVLPSHNRVDIKFCITIQSFYVGGCSVEKLSK